MKSLIFKPELARLIQTGRKTETRRFRDPGDIKGETFYIKTKWRVHKQFDHLKPLDIPEGVTLGYSEDRIADPGKWRSALHLPTHLAKTFIEIEEVWQESLQDVSEQGARAEADERIDLAQLEVEEQKSWEEIRPFMNLPCEEIGCPYRNGFARVWNSIYKDEGDRWEDNPRVHAIRFKLVDAVAAEERRAV